MCFRISQYVLWFLHIYNYIETSYFEFIHGKMLCKAIISHDHYYYGISCVLSKYLKTAVVNTILPSTMCSLL